MADLDLNKMDHNGCAHVSTLGIQSDLLWLFFVPVKNKIKSHGAPGWVSEEGLKSCSVALCVLLRVTKLTVCQHINPTAQAAVDL